MRFALLIACATLVQGLAQAATHNHDTKPQVLAPGYGPLEFSPPAPGSYELPPLGEAANGIVLDSTGKRVNLHDLFENNVVVLSFIYTRCNDVNGCPLATHVLKDVQDRAMSSGLSGMIRLVSLSFDPSHDTPEVMKTYASHFKNSGFDWRFVTCRSEDELEPILKSYDQWVLRDRDAEGNDLGTISHILRVFLIDTHKRIRNIYSISFLHADTVISDIKTLLMESRSGYEGSALTTQ